MMIAINSPGVLVYGGDASAMLSRIPSGRVQTCVTSPPYYGLRDYGIPGQIGLEETPDAYVARLVAVFEEVRRVLKPDGTLWLNLGDSYGAKKQLLGVPWRVAFALQAAGWYLRSDIIWAKPNPMPESVTDRPTKAHEYLFLLAKSERYFYDADAVKEPDGGKPARNGFKGRQGGARDLPMSGGGGTVEPWTPGKGRNRRTVWTVTPKPFKGAHFATMPPDLVRPCVLAGSRPGDVVLDPFNGAGTTGMVARSVGRRYVGVELNPEYVEITRARLAGAA